MTLDYLAHLRENSARFAAVIREAPADGQVPSCPDWRSDDLLWHLAEVQWFWGTVVHEAVEDPGGIEHPHRPQDRAALLAFFDDATRLLQSALAATDPAERRWTWSEDQTAGFILRRQAHEALVHRLDAELTADVPRASMDPALCSDGVDEALRVMFGGAPSWARVELDPTATLRLRAVDTGQEWLVTLGTFSGTSPDSGKVYDGSPVVEVADGSGDGAGNAAATVTGTAADLDCWLWGRPATGELERTGDEDVHARFQAILDEGID
jgi:uncharacterized protein (TIGR03083 family)